MVKKNKQTVKKKALKTPRKKSVSASVVNIGGKTVEKTVLPDAFKTPAKDVLLAQAVRVYQANKRKGTQSTKTRGEVIGSTRKIYRQKGTGRARHGDIKAPIFVGGGIVHGPKPRDFSLKLTAKMRKRALFGALSEKATDGKILIIDTFEKLGPKTKTVAAFLSKLKLDGTKTLCAITDKRENFERGARNIKKVNIIRAKQLNAYDVISHEQIIFEKSALSSFKKIK